MDLFESAGMQALPLRMKRLSDRLREEGLRVYRETGLGFEPRWFPVYFYLVRRGPSAMITIAGELGVSHAAVSQVAGEMIAVNLLAAYRDRSDKRKRVLALTSHGRAQLPALEKVWEALEAAVGELLDDTGASLEMLDSLDRELSRRSLFERFVGHYRANS